ncbi:MAG: zf-HC2 domain-containing protein [Phycisphaerae bacterium]|nr:zf-HC2 domain-containing protein [Phycisphaerae bacterium]
MNCEETLDNLLDLVYGELDISREKALREHLTSCKACRAEYEKLARARTALAAYRADEPQRDAGVSPRSTGVPLVSRMGVSPMQHGLGSDASESARAATASRDEFQPTAATGETPVGRMGGTPMLRRVRTVRLWRVGMAAAAVVVAAVVLMWVLVAGPGSTDSPIGLPIAHAAPMDEIVREDVSLTILSNPAESMLIQPGVRRGVAREWGGLSLVRDQRMSRSLRAGETTVMLSDIPTGIVPGSVAIRPMNETAGFSVLEQNYQFDLASASALLAKCVGQPISLTLKDESAVEGELLSWSPGEVLLTVDGQPRNVPFQAVKALRTARMPEGLLVKPTLVWKLTSDEAKQNLPLEVAYLTSGLSWRADYVLTLAPGMLAQLGKAGLPEILDAADLVGYATVTNRSGTTFHDAQLKLMAGDVNLVPDAARKSNELTVGGTRLRRVEEKREQGFEEQSFFEYHLYTLRQRTTLRDQETKQIQMITGSGMKMKRAYVYDPRMQIRAPRVVSELKNSKANNLGSPLPKGVIRLYAPDAEGVNTYVAQTTIDHTPANEKLRLPWGHAFDIVCDWRETRRTTDGPDRMFAWRYTLHNAKDYDVTVTCVVPVPFSTYEFRVEGPYTWRQRQVGWLEFDVPLQAGEKIEVECFCRYNNEQGGGLVVPATEEDE